MTVDQRLTNLEKRVNALYDIVNRNNFYTGADIAGTRQSVSEITPYKVTKKAYIDETFLIFTDIPQGNMTVFCPVDYTAERIGNSVTVSFEPLTEVTDITIMIQ